MIRCLALLALLVTGIAGASVTVTDDAGRTLTLKAPARRIVSLAPNITDALFAAGAGAYVVGTSRFSDHPAEAKKVAIVGDATMIDLERIVGLKPDIIVVWRSGTPAAQVEKLSRLGIPIFYSETTRLADVAPATRRFGVLAGTQDQAERNAAAFDAALARLRDSYAGKTRLKVFYQIWDRPLMTIGHAQIIDDALDLCGGDNIFGDLAQAAPTVTREAVLARNPDVIVGGDGGHDALAGWRRSGFLSAVKHDNVIAIDAPTLALPSPSILGSVDRLCHALDEARDRGRH
ncbi:MAG TPA: cobalamin-binding protein [Luteibacter sp.]|uniref:cobalamin-binding protein n=1 Tax=Luteibacter sp. TaxID=1886636 RepID=UPI002D1486D9|nr:cobalamin-binding protein [Luteibacter sp.]HVI56660.1 cobalamin-binding protein [Luteibacter sp.]